MTQLQAHQRVEQTLYCTVKRGSKATKILIGGGARWRRLLGVYQILGWNRWAYADAEKRGIEFPIDAPRHLWQGKWRSAWLKGNI